MSNNDENLACSDDPLYLFSNIQNFWVPILKIKIKWIKDMYCLVLSIHCQTRRTLLFS